MTCWTWWNRSSLLVSIVSVAFLPLLGLGCGGAIDEGPERVPVRGTVTFKGEPIEDGKIRFVPSEGTTGPVTIAIIENGMYTADHRGGVPIGSHRVEIEAFRPVPGAKPVSQELAQDFSDIEAGDVPKEQYIPLEFNGETSTLSVNLESGAVEAVVKDFSLE